MGVTEQYHSIDLDMALDLEAIQDGQADIPFYNKQYNNVQIGIFNRANTLAENNQRALRTMRMHAEIHTDAFIQNSYEIIKTVCKAEIKNILRDWRNGAKTAQAETQQQISHLYTILRNNEIFYISEYKKRGLQTKLGAYPRQLRFDYLRTLI